MYSGAKDNFLDFKVHTLDIKVLFYIPNFLITVKPIKAN